MIEATSHNSKHPARSAGGVSLVKRCSKCAQEFPLDEFPPRKSSRDGRHGWCRPCFRAYYGPKGQEWREKNRERVRQKARERYAKNPEKFRARRRQYYEEYRERALEAVKRWYRENDGAARAREKRERNPEPQRAASRRYYQRHRAEILDRANHRRLLYEATPLPLEFLELLLSSPCSYCGATENIEMDHIKPISRGGLHEPRNLTAACRTCNRSKGNRLLSEWIGVLV